MGKKTKIALGVGGVLVVLAALGSAGDPDATKAEATPKVAEQQQPETAPTEVTAAELYSAFDKNEVAAQKRYGGQVLAVTGVIEDITLDLTNDPVVRLAGGNGPLASVSAHFPKDATDATASLEKRQKVTVVCGKVSEVMGMPQLNDCKLR